MRLPIEHQRELLVSENVVFCVCTEPKKMCGGGKGNGSRFDAVCPCVAAAEVSPFDAQSTDSPSQRQQMVVKRLSFCETLVECPGSLKKKTADTVTHQIFVGKKIFKSMMKDESKTIK